ncbi:hypothetical protein K438DRAFT_1932243 [Mycena galopus ATCC 62051]|nr:hypothetical protein K438DRAFT_1932243 [Mycena galopus ATCC 62051]
MLRLTTRLKTKGIGLSALPLRRLHDVPRAGIVFPVDHIDIAPAAQRSSIIPPPTATRGHAPSESPSPQGQFPPEPLAHPAPLYARDSADNWRSEMVLCAVMLLVIAIANRFSPGNIKLARRFIAQAPDLAVLQQDPDALAAHLDALGRIILAPSGPQVSEAFVQALARHRTAGDIGRSAIAETCVQLHETIQAKNLDNNSMGRRLSMIMKKFVDHGIAEQKVDESTISEPESTESADSPWQNDYPPLKG